MIELNRDEAFKELEETVKKYLKAVAGECPFCDLAQNARCECDRLEGIEKKAEQEISLH
jgi:hypothetical protein